MRAERNRKAADPRQRMPLDELRGAGIAAHPPVDFVRSSSLSPYAKATWLVLSTWTDPCPGTKLLAALVPCSRPTLHKSLEELEAASWLEVDHRNTVQARKTNRYRLDYRTKTPPTVGRRAVEIPAKLVRSGTVSPYAKVLWAIWASFGTNRRPSEDDLASMVPCSPRMIYKCLSHLLAEGWLKVRTPRRPRASVGEKTSYILRRSPKPTARRLHEE